MREMGTDNIKRGDEIATQGSEHSFLRSESKGTLMWEPCHKGVDWNERTDEQVSEGSANQSS